MSLEDDFVSNIRWITPPALLTAPQPVATPGFSGSVDGRGFSAVENVVGDDASSTLDVTASAGRTDARTTLSREGASVGAGLTMGYNWLALTGSQVSSRPGGSVVGNEVMLSTTFGNIGLGAGRTVATEAGSVALWGMGAVSAGRSVVDLGPVEGGRRVRLESSKGLGLWGSAGMGLFHPGIGTTLAHDRRRRSTYVTTLTDDQAREALFEQRGVAGFVRDRARALGLWAEKLATPPLDQPEALKVGDEVAVAVVGSVAGGIAVGLPMVRAGLQAMMEGEFQLAVRKLSPTQVELVVAPTRLRGMQFFAVSGTPLAVSKSSFYGFALRQGFVFDLSVPEAREAYQSALRGKLPRGLEVVESGPSVEDATVQLASGDSLPPGVQRSVVEASRTHSLVSSVGIEWANLERVVGAAGLADIRTGTTSQHARADGQRLVVDSVRNLELRRARLLSGTETLGICAITRRVTEPDQTGALTTRFVGLQLVAHDLDTRVRGLEPNKQVLGRLNSSFGLDIPPFHRPGRGLARAVTVSLCLTEESIERLAHTSGEVAWARALEAGAEPGPLTAMVSQLAELSLFERTELIQTYVGREGLEAMGALHRLLGESVDGLSVTTSAETYSQVGRALRKLQLKYPRPIELSDGPEAIARRFAEAHQLASQAVEALRDAEDDPLLTDEERQLARNELQAAYLAAVHVTDFSRLGREDMRVLREQLEGGWRSERRARLRAFMELEHMGG